jgi:magnesium transporter
MSDSQEAPRDAGIPLETLLEEINAALAGGNKERLHDLLQEFHPVDLANLLELLPLSSREKIWGLFGAEVFLGDLLSHIHQALESEESAQVRSLLEGLDSDDIANLLTFLPSLERKKVWAMLDAERKGEVWSMAPGEVKADVSLDDLIQRVQESLDEQEFPQVQDLLGKLHPADIANLLESLPPEAREQVWDLVSPDLDGDVLAYVQGMVRETLLAGMEAAEVAAATEKLDTDDAVDILQDLPEDRVEQVLQAMDAQRRQRLSKVLTYPEDTAGGLMNLDVLTVRAEVCLEVVLRYLRRHEELPEKTDMLLVIDRDNRYLGALPLSRLLTSDPEREVGEVMAVNVAGIPPHMPARDVANLFARHDWITAPVVDDNGFLLGRITIDDVVDVIREEADHDLMSRAGLDEEDDMFAPAFVTARQRALWLGINLLTALLAAWVIGLFEHTLEKLVALAVLMPIVASMGGIAGTQTSTVMIRGMALGKVTRSNTGWLFRRELLVGSLNGLVWALVVGLVAILWFGNYKLGVIIGAAIVINLAFAALCGTLIPLILRRFSIDPALASGVILTTVTDVLGFFAFLGLATVFLLG